LPLTTIEGVPSMPYALIRSSARFILVLTENELATATNSFGSTPKFCA